jgi:hypothetical protein
MQQRVSWGKMQMYPWRDEVHQVIICDRLFLARIFGLSSTATRSHMQRQAVGFVLLSQHCQQWWKVHTADKTPHLEALEDVVDLLCAEPKA